MTSRLAGIAALLTLAACTGDDTDDTDTDGTPEVAACFDGIMPRDFIADGAGLNFGDVAGDFTVNELDGDRWTLSSAYSGCDVYVFVVYHPSYQSSEQMFGSDVRALLETDENVHYFILSEESDENARRSRMETLRDEISAPPAWDGRLHFVVDRATQTLGSIREMMVDYKTWSANPNNVVDLGDRGRAPAPKLVAFGIDRNQTWDPGGSMSEYVGGPASFRMPSYLGMFYNHKARVADEIASTEATEVVVLDETVTERIFTVPVTLPDAGTMAGFDTMEFDVEVTCNERNPFACSEWDRIAHVELCTEGGEECTARRELTRWITPYWRRGERRWLIDATPLMGLLTDGGEQTMRVSMGPGWERKTERDVRIALRLRTQGDQPKPIGAERVFTGGSFDATYNDRDTVSFTPPANATRVELVHILSGHGQTTGDNCAEWCDHRHVFSVNGTDLPEIKSQSGIGSTGGCAVYAAEGVSPGQWGNWAPQRAYWCPGLPVPAERIDITSNVTVGSENTLDYRGVFKGGAPRGGSISLSAYVVWYAD